MLLAIVACSEKKIIFFSLTSLDSKEHTQYQCLVVST